MSKRLFAVVVVLVYSSQFLPAQEVSGYRAYALASSVDAVLIESGSSAADVRVLHDRPAMIQELDWRARYARNKFADPVRSIIFSFCDNALYQVVVSYDTARTEGLDNSDVIGALTATYGTAGPASAHNRPLEAAADTVILAQWDRAGSSLTLLRGVYSAEFQLLLTSKVLGTRARGAIREAGRLAAADSLRRE